MEDKSEGIRSQPRDQEIVALKAAIEKLKEIKQTGSDMENNCQNQL